MHSMVSTGMPSDSFDENGKGSLRRKKLERKVRLRFSCSTVDCIANIIFDMPTLIILQISTISSTMSEDSLALEDAMEAVGSAVGFSRLGSTRASRRSNHLKRGISTMEEDDDEDGGKEPKPDAWRVLKTNSPEWPYIAVGLVSSVIMGASMPIYAILFGEVMGILSDPIDSARDDSVLYAILFVGVGVVVGTAMFLQILMFTVAGEHLTLRMRKMAFRAMLGQEMGWFDQPANSTGALCARLSADAAAIQGVSELIAIFKGVRVLRLLGAMIVTSVPSSFQPPTERRCLAVVWAQ